MVTSQTNLKRGVIFTLSGILISVLSLLFADQTLFIEETGMYEYRPRVYLLGGFILTLTDIIITLFGIYNFVEYRQKKGLAASSFHPL